MSEGEGRPTGGVACLAKRKEKTVVNAEHSARAGKGRGHTDSSQGALEKRTENSYRKRKSTRRGATKQCAKRWGRAALGRVGFGEKEQRKLTKADAR